ncbi:MAG: NADH-quinone oxidoreductase subunit C [Hyphomicrobiales bacterium]
MGTRYWTGEELAAAAERLVPGSVARFEAGCCYLKPEHLVETMSALRTDPETDFVYLANLCGADYWDRLEVVYHLHSLVKNHMGTFKCETYDRENPVIPSVFPVWFGAWMQEAEAYDMFGINFEGNPRQYRILLWEGFPGWPLRKDWLSMPGGLQPGLNEFAGVARRQEPPVKAFE